MTKALFVILILITSFQLSTNAQSSWRKGDVTIHGKIINFDRHKDNHTIQFDFVDIFQRKSKGILKSQIDSNGEFAIKVQILYPQDFDIIYGRRAKLLCVPGDSLFLEIDADIFDNPLNLKPNNEYFVRVTGGNRVKDNVDLVEFLNGELSSIYNGKAISEAITTKTANEFKAYNSLREKEYRSFLSVYKKEKNTSDLFNQWIDDYLKYQTCYELFVYPFEHSYNNNVSEASVKLPADYYDFLQNYPMNDFQIISSKHVSVLQSYTRYVLENKKDSTYNVCKLIDNKGIIEASKIELQRIQHETSGFFKNFILTKYYLNLINAQLLKEFDAVYDSSYITVPYFRNVIAEEYTELKNFMTNQLTDGSNLNSLISSDEKSIIKEICEKYSGKVIYIDFWAPWCAPCMAELEHSKALQEIYKGKDIVFLFLANNCKEDSWKATIANKKLTGEHMLLTNIQYKQLAESFGIKGIPHYVLIDKDGKLISKNATRPSEKYAIKSKLNKLLDNKKITMP